MVADNHLRQAARFGSNGDLAAGWPFQLSTLEQVKPLHRTNIRCQQSVTQKSEKGGGFDRETAVAPLVWQMTGSFVDFTLLARATEETRSFKTGEKLFSEGDAGHEFFVIKTGSVAVRQGNKTLQVLSEGEIFGEMALIDNEPRSATVVAESDCVVVPLSEKQFVFMASEAPYFALNVMRVLAKRLRVSNSALPGG